MGSEDEEAGADHKQEQISTEQIKLETFKLNSVLLWTFSI